MQINNTNSTTSNAVTVSPAGSSLETRLVLLFAAITLFVCAGIIKLRQHADETKQPLAYQISAFEDLRPSELATFNALISAVPDIEAYHNDEQHWPSIDELRDDYIPPFVQDVAWKKAGRLAWRRNILNADENHIALYQGRPANKNTSGSFLLVMLHGHKKAKASASGPVHAPYEVWLHPSPNVELPEMMGDQALINMGWREIVARRGEDEIKKTKDAAYLK